MSLTKALFSACGRYPRQWLRRTRGWGRSQRIVAIYQEASRARLLGQFSPQVGERLEPRLAMAVDVQILGRETVAGETFPGRIYVTVDGGSDVHLQNAQVTHSAGSITHDLLVADNSSFLNPKVVNEVDGGDYDSLTIFSGTRREDIDIVAQEWWILDTGGDRNTTGLLLHSGAGIYAAGLLDGTEEPATRVDSSNPLNEVYGEISYTQYDGTISRWYFSNRNFRTQEFSPNRAFITAGPGIPVDSGQPNRTSLHEPLFIAEQPLADGYVYPTGITLDSSSAEPLGQDAIAANYGRRILVTWSQTPTRPPIVRATFPATLTADIITTPGLNIVYRFSDAVAVVRETVQGTLSRGDLEFALPSAFQTGADGSPPSLGVVPGTLHGEFRVQSSARGRGLPPAYPQVGIADLISRADATGAVRHGFSVQQSLDFAAGDSVLDELLDLDDLRKAIREETVTYTYANEDAPLRDLQVANISERELPINPRTGLNVGDDFSRIQFAYLVDETGRTVRGRLDTVVQGGIRGYRVPGVNVEPDSSPTLNADYLTYTRDLPATVTFAAGADIEQEVIVDLTAPGSTIFVNSPIRTTTVAGDIDLRATNVVVNAEIKVDDRFDLGRSSSDLINSDDRTSQPRLTIDSPDPGGNDDGFFDTPTLQPQNWQFGGRDVLAVPVLGPGGRVEKIDVPAGAEGYGYDPSNPPEVVFSPPQPQAVELNVLAVSGGLSDSITIGSSGVAIPDGITEVRIPANEEDFQYRYVRKITAGGAYDFTNANGELDTRAVPVVVVAEPDVLRNETRIGFGRSAKVTAEWSTGIEYVQVTDGGLYTQTGTAGKVTPAAPFNPVINFPAPTEGSIRFRATVPIPASKQIVNTTTEGQTTTTKSQIQTGLYPTSIIGAGYDKDNPPTLSAPYGIQAVVPPDAFRENILSLRVTDGGMNYEGTAPVIDLVTKFDLTGVAVEPAYVPESGVDVVAGSSFIGPEIKVGFVTSITSTYAARNLFEYLDIGMPIVGDGLRDGATIIGIDRQAGIVGLSPNAITAPSLLANANVYPHEWYIEPANQPDPEKIANLVMTPTLAVDDAILRIEGRDGEILSASWADPEFTRPLRVSKSVANTYVTTREAAFDPLSGEFAGVRGGGGYTAVPSGDQVVDVLREALQVTWQDAFSLTVGVTPPTLSFQLNGQLAEVAVVSSGSNYLSRDPGRNGTIELLVFGAADGSDASVSFEVSDGAFTGGGRVLDPGAGFLGSGPSEATVEIVSPDDYEAGDASIAIFRAIVSEDGAIREFARVSAGAEYATTPQVFVESPPVLTPARASSRIDRVAGTVSAISLDRSGTGYRIAPEVIIEAPGPEGVGRRARAVALLSDGRLAGIEVIDPGSGYTVAPRVTIGDPTAPTVVENFIVNADIIAGVYEWYLANEKNDATRAQGSLRVSPQAVVGGAGGGGAQLFFLEAYAANLDVEGRLRAAEQQLNFISPQTDTYAGPFTIEANVEGDRLIVLLGNQSPPGLSDAYTHDVRLVTKVSTFRVGAADIGFGDNEAFPYNLAIENAGDLIVDSVLRSGGNISLKVDSIPGNPSAKLTVESSIQTERGLSIEAEQFTVESPIESKYGPISLKTTEASLEVLNGVSVTDAALAPNDVDVIFQAEGGDINIQGNVSALNTIEFVASNKVSGPNATIASDEIVVSAEGDVELQTRARSLKVQTTPAAAVVVREQDDLKLDIQSGSVDILANGVDGGQNDVALSGVLRDVNTVILAAPRGSIDVRDDASGQIVVGTTAEGGTAGIAAGDVTIQTEAVRVRVVDAAIGGGEAEIVDVATSGAFVAAEVVYNPGITGLVTSTLSGTGGINEVRQLNQGEDLRKGDRVLVKDQVGEAGIGARVNGIYEVTRIGGGERGYANWQLTRAADASTQENLPSGSFVRVQSGLFAGSVFQVDYVQRIERVATVNREGQVSFDERSGNGVFGGIDLGTFVTGPGIIEGATVQAIDTANRVVTLGLIDGQSVRYLTNAEVQAARTDGRIRNPDGVQDWGRVFGLQITDGSGNPITARNTPLEQAIDLAINSDNKEVRVSGVGLTASAEIIAFGGGVLVLEPGSEGSGDDWSDLVRESRNEPKQVRIGFADVKNDGRSLNPAARAQLLTLPIQRVGEDIIYVSPTFYRWDAVRVGQPVYGAGISETAVVQQVNVAAGTIRLNQGAIAEELPAAVTLLSVGSGIRESAVAYDRIYLDGAALGSAGINAIQPGDLVLAGGVRPFAEVVGVDGRENALLLAPGTIRAFGGVAEDPVRAVQILVGNIGKPRLDTAGGVVPVVGVSQFSAEATSGDFVRLQITDESAFNDAMFERLWLGMEVSGEGLRHGAVVTRVDAANRVVGLSSGSIVGPVRLLQFHDPIYDVHGIADGQTIYDVHGIAGGQGGSGLLEKSLAELEGIGFEPFLAAEVEAWSAETIGRMDANIYRVLPSDSTVALAELPEASRRRFVEEPTAGWSDYVFPGQQVVTDLVKFSGEMLPLEATEELLGAVLVPVSDLDDPRYQGSDGTRGYGLTYSADANEVRLVRFDHVRSGSDARPLERSAELSLDTAEETPSVTLEWLTVADNSFLAISINKKLIIVGNGASSLNPVKVSEEDVGGNINGLSFEAANGQLFVASETELVFYGVDSSGSLTRETPVATITGDILSAADRVFAVTEDGGDVTLKGFGTDLSEEWGASGALPGDKAGTVALSPDGQRVYVTSFDSQEKLWTLSVFNRTDFESSNRRDIESVGQLELEITITSDPDKTSRRLAQSEDGVRQLAVGSVNGDDEVSLALGGGGLLIVSTATSSGDPDLRVSSQYNLAENVLGFLADAGQGLGSADDLLFLGSQGELTAWQRVDPFNRGLPRGSVTGVDYALGLLSITGDAYGIGDDRKIVTVGEERFAMAPEASLRLLTEAVIAGGLPRLNDTSQPPQLDDGTVVEIQRGTFDEGYIVASDIFGAADQAWDANGIEPWESLGNMLNADGPKFYVANRFGEWVLAGQLTGLDSYNNLVGLKSIDDDVPVHEMIRTIATGTGIVRMLVDQDPTELTLSDGGVVYDPVGFDGDEVEITVAGQRPYDTVEDLGDRFSGSTSDHALRVRDDFQAYSLVIPGMRAFGDGLPAAGSLVRGVDHQNGIVWLDDKRDFNAARSEPTDRFVVFSYAMSRGSAIEFTAQDLPVDGSARPNDFSGGIMLVSPEKLLGVGGVIPGMAVQPVVTGQTAEGGLVTGVDYAAGVIGVAAGTILDSDLPNRDSDLANELRVEFASFSENELAVFDRNGNGWLEEDERNLRDRQPVSVYITAANSSNRGFAEGIAVRLAGTDEGDFRHWSRVVVGSGVAIEFATDVAGGRETRFVGAVAGLDPQIGMLSIALDTDRGVDEAFLLEQVAADGSLRLLLLDVPEGSETPAYDAADPDYSQHQTVRAVALIDSLGFNFSRNGDVKRPGISSSGSRHSWQNYVVVDGNEGVDVDQHAVVSRTEPIELGEVVAWRSDKGIIGDGVVVGSTLTSVYASSAGWLVATELNAGVASPVDGNRVSVQSSSSSEVITTEYRGSYAGDLIRLVGGFEDWEPLIEALEKRKTLTVTVGRTGPDPTYGAGVRANAKIIGLDPANQIIVLEEGAIVHANLVDLRFFVDGVRLSRSGESLMAATVASGDDPGYLPDASVAAAVAVGNEGKFTPVVNHDGSGVALLRLETRLSVGGVFGQQSRFNRYSEIEVDDPVRVGGVAVGRVKGIDAINGLVGVEIDDIVTGAPLVNAGSVLTIGGLGVTPVPGDEINNLIVVEAASFGQSHKGILSSAASGRVSRVTVGQAFTNYDQITVGDYVTGAGLADHIVNDLGQLAGPRIVGIDRQTRTIAIAYSDADGTIAAQRSAVTNAAVVSSLAVHPAELRAAGTLQPPSALVPTIAATGFIDGDFVEVGGVISTAGSLPSDLQIGVRVEADPREGSLGKGGRVTAWAAPLGVLVVGHGLITSNRPGSLITFASRAGVDGWSEPQGNSGGYNFENYTFNQTRILVSAGGVTNAEPTDLDRVRLGAPVSVGGEVHGYLTGYDRDLGLIGLESASSSLGVGDSVDIPILELAASQVAGELIRDSVEGIFEGTRFIFRGEQLTTPAGQPFATADLRIGMPVWDQNFNIVAHITGIAEFRDVGARAEAPVVLLGLTANTSNGFSNSDIAVGGPAEIGRNEVVSFGGYRVNGSPVDVVAKLDRIDFPAGITDHTELLLQTIVDDQGNVTRTGRVIGSAGTAEIFQGFNTARVRLAAGFGLYNDSILGASVSGRGIMPGTIVTAYDRGLDLIGLSAPPLGLSAGAVLEIIPGGTVTPAPVSATVVEMSAGHVGDLNGDLGTAATNWNRENSVIRLRLSDEAILPSDLGEWLGAEVGQAVGGTLGGAGVPELQAQIVGIDAEARLLAIKTVRLAAGGSYEPVVQAVTSPAIAQLSSITPSAWLSAGHSSRRESGSLFSLATDTPLFVDPSSLVVERLDGPSREVQALGGSRFELLLQVEASDDLGWLRTGMLVADDDPLTAPSIPTGTIVAEIEATTDPQTGTITTTVTLANPDPALEADLNVAGFSGPVLFATVSQDEARVGDRLLVTVGEAGSRQQGSYQIAGIDPLLGLVMVDDRPGASDSESLAWLLGRSTAHRFEVAAAAAVTDLSPPITVIPNGIPHTFDQARVFVDQINDANSPTNSDFDWSNLFVGMQVTGRGLNPEAQIIVTGIDQQLGMIGLGVQGGGLSGVSGRFSDRVIVDGANLGELLFVSTGITAETAAVNPDWRPVMEKDQQTNEQLLPDQQLLRLADGFDGFGWLAETLDGIDAGGVPWSELRIVAEIESPDDDPNNSASSPVAAFTLTHKQGSEVIVGIDSQLALVQVDTVGVPQADFSRVSHLRFERVAADGTPLSGSDQALRVQLQSFATGQAAVGHGLASQQLQLGGLSVEEFSELQAAVSGRAFVRGSGLLANTRVTDLSIIDGVPTIVLPAGSLLNRGELFSAAADGVITLDTDTIEGNGNDRTVVVTSIASEVVGDLSGPRISLPLDFTDYAAIGLGTLVSGAGLAPGARVTGYDAANRIVGLNQGSVFSAAKLSGAAVRFGRAVDVVDSGFASSGQLDGDRLTFSEPLDLGRVSIGSRIRGDGLAVSARVIGIAADRNQVVLTPGAIVQPDAILQVTIGTDPRPLLIKPGSAVRSIGTTTETVVRIVDSFVQYPRIYVGMPVTGPGLSKATARVTGIDAANRLLFLSDTSVNSLEALISLGFNDADGNFSAGILRDEDGPRVSFGTTNPESTIRGNLDGDLFIVDEGSRGVFDQLELGQPLEAAAFQPGAVIVGFDPRTGIIAVPRGFLRTSDSGAEGQRLSVTIADGFNAESVDVLEADGTRVALRFSGNDASSLAAVIVGQRVIGDGIRGVVTVSRLDLINSVIEIESADGEAVLVQTGSEASPPTNIQFLQATEISLGAVVSVGTEKVRFEVDEFGITPITIRTPASKLLTEVKPWSDSILEVKGVSAFTNLERDQELSGDNVRDGFRFLAPVIEIDDQTADMRFGAQVYSGELLAKRLKVSSVGAVVASDAGQDAITQEAITWLFGQGFNQATRVEVSTNDEDITRLISEGQDLIGQVVKVNGGEVGIITAIEVLPSTPTDPTSGPYAILGIQGDAFPSDAVALVIENSEGASLDLDLVAGSVADKIETGRFNADRLYGDIRQLSGHGSAVGELYSLDYTVELVGLVDYESYLRPYARLTGIDPAGGLIGLSAGAIDPAKLSDMVGKDLLLRVIDAGGQEVMQHTILAEAAIASPDGWRASLSPQQIQAGQTAGFAGFLAELVFRDAEGSVSQTTFRYGALSPDPDEGQNKVVGLTSGSTETPADFGKLLAVVPAEETIWLDPSDTAVEKVFGGEEADGTTAHARYVAIGSALTREFGAQNTSGETSIRFHRLKAETKTEIGTSDPTGRTTFVVSTGGATDNDDPGSLGKMLAVWQAAAASKALIDQNPEYLFRFADDLAPIRLRQALPVINKPLFIDGSITESGANRENGSPIVVDGSFIQRLADESPVDGEPVHGFVFRDIDIFAEAVSQPVAEATRQMLSESKPEVGIKGVRISGFSNGAAIRLDGSTGVLVDDVELGINESLQQSANQQGVWITGESEWNVVSNSRVVTSDDVGVRIDSASEFNTIVGTVIGDNQSNNKVGVVAADSRNWIGARSDLLPAPVTASGLLREPEQEDLGYRVLELELEPEVIRSIRPGMGISLSGFFNLRLQIAAVDPDNRTVTVSSDDNFNGLGLDQIPPTSQRVTATIGYQAKGDFNNGQLALDADTWSMLAGGVYLGQTVSGNGVPADSVITHIREDNGGNRFLTLSAPLNVNGYRAPRNDSAAVSDADEGSTTFKISENELQQLAFDLREGMLIQGQGVAAGVSITSVSKIDGAIEVEISAPLQQSLETIEFVGDWNRLLGFGASDRATVIGRNQVGIQLGLGAKHVQGVNGSKVIYFPDGFTGWSGLKIGMEVVFSREPGSPVLSGNPYLVADFHEPSGTVALDKPLELTDPREPLLSTPAFKRSVVFLDHSGSKPGVVVQNVAVTDGFNNGIELLGAEPHQIGAEADFGNIEYRQRPAGSSTSPQPNVAVDERELASWEIEVDVARGQRSVAIDPGAAAVLRQFAIDLSSTERENFDETVDVYSEDLEGRNVYGRGIPTGAQVVSYGRENGELRLTFDEPFNVTDRVTLAFGVGWFTTASSVRVGDRAVSQLDENVAEDGLVPGRHLPQFTEVRAVGVDHIRISTPSAGLRVRVQQESWRGTEGFLPKAPTADGSTQPPPAAPEKVAFVSASGLGNTIAGNFGYGIWATAAALSAIDGLSEHDRPQIAGNQVDAVFSATGNLLDSRNRLGGIDAEVFKVLAGYDFEENDWDRADQFANYFGAPDYSFEVPLEGEPDDPEGRRPIYWYE